MPKGFTLLELMVTLAVLGIILGLAVPSMRQFILNQRVVNASYDLSGAMQFARSEATKRKVDVVISQAAGGWQNGWNIVNSADNSVLRTHDPFPDLAVTASLTSITYRHTGRTTTAAGATFTLDASPATSGVKSRCLMLNLSGMVSVC
jgi:type IV fimbrial biogenesis protein FimT